MNIRNSLIKSPFLPICSGLIFIIIVCCSASAWSKDKFNRKIIVYMHCSSKEASNDIGYSIDQINIQLKSMQIHIINSKQLNRCGYLFINGRRKKFIGNSMTDIDLLNKAHKFFCN